MKKKLLACWLFLLCIIPSYYSCKSGRTTNKECIEKSIQLLYPLGETDKYPFGIYTTYTLNSKRYFFFVWEDNECADFYQLVILDQYTRKEFATFETENNFCCFDYNCFEEYFLKKYSRGIEDTLVYFEYYVTAYKGKKSVTTLGSALFKSKKVLFSFNECPPESETEKENRGFINLHTSGEYIYCSDDCSYFLEDSNN